MTVYTAHPVDLGRSLLLLMLLLLDRCESAESGLPAASRFALSRLRNASSAGESLNLSAYSVDFLEAGRPLDGGVCLSDFVAGAGFVTKVGVDGLRISS